MKIYFKNWKTYFESLISPSFDELHYSTIVHMSHMEHMFQDLPFTALRRSQKTTINFFTFVPGSAKNGCQLCPQLQESACLKRKCQRLFVIPGQGCRATASHCSLTVGCQPGPLSQISIYYTTLHWATQLVLYILHYTTLGHLVRSLYTTH